MEANFKQLPDHLNVLVGGRFQVEEAVAVFGQILETCRETGQTSVLIDFSGLTDVDSATLRVIFAVNARELYERYLEEGGQLLRVAFFGSFLSWQPGMEAASQNRPGVRTFTDLHEAHAWLGC